MEKRWAVLRAQAHREAFVAQSVSSRGVECYIPVRPARKPGAANILFPGYVFAQVSPSSDDLLRIRSAPGVAYVLPRTGAPALLPDPLIGAIRAKEEELRARPAARQFSNGEQVRVLTGPFKWVEGVFDRKLSASGRVRILLSLASGGMAVQMSATDLEAVLLRGGSSFA
jgi:transcription antitermination factor NusG